MSMGHILFCFGFFHLFTTQQGFLFKIYYELVIVSRQKWTTIKKVTTPVVLRQSRAYMKCKPVWNISPSVKGCWVIKYTG